MAKPSKVPPFQEWYPKLLYSDFLSIYCLAWIDSARMAGDQKSSNTDLINRMKDFLGLDEDDAGSDSLLMKFVRIRKDHYEFNKQIRDKEPLIPKGKVIEQLRKVNEVSAHLLGRYIPVCSYTSEDGDSCDKGTIVSSAKEGLINICPGCNGSGMEKKEPMKDFE